METAWQILVVLAIVLAAGGYLCRLGWQSMARRKASACGGCSNCPAASISKDTMYSGPDVVSIGPCTPPHEIELHGMNQGRV